MSSDLTRDRERGTPLWRTERVWMKHHERIPDRWVWDISDALGVIATLPEDDEHEAEANAHLMAQAPEMLALLREVAEANASGEGGHEDVWDAVDAFVAANERPRDGSTAEPSSTTT